MGAACSTARMRRDLRRALLQWHPPVRRRGRCPAPRVSPVRRRRHATVILEGRWPAARMPGRPGRHRQRRFIRWRLGRELASGAVAQSCLRLPLARGSPSTASSCCTISASLRARARIAGASMRTVSALANPAFRPCRATRAETVRSVSPQGRCRGRATRAPAVPRAARGAADRQVHLRFPPEPPAPDDSGAEARQRQGDRSAGGHARAALVRNAGGTDE